MHVSRYLSWKALEALIKENRGVDVAMQRQIDSGTAKCRENSEVHIRCYTFFSGAQPSIERIQ